MENLIPAEQWNQEIQEEAVNNLLNDFEWMYSKRNENMVGKVSNVACRKKWQDVVEGYDQPCSEMS